MELAVTRTATLTNPDVGDLQLDDKGDVVLLTSLAEEVAQRLFVRLQFFAGEWFMDLNEGTPYYQSILRKASDSVVRSIFRQVIDGTEGVSEVQQFSYSVAQRNLTLRFRARLTDGTAFRSEDFGPFTISVDQPA
jgi:hypothetical protein